MPGREEQLCWDFQYTKFPRIPSGKPRIDRSIVNGVVVDSLQEQRDLWEVEIVNQLGVMHHPKPHFYHDDAALRIPSCEVRNEATQRSNIL